MKTKIVLVTLLCMLGPVAWAQEESPVDVENYSFELPGTVKCKNWDGETTYPDVPGWTDGDATAGDSGVEQPSVGGASDGTWIGFIRAADEPVYQVTSHIIGAGKDYTLTVDGRATSGGAGANLQLTLELFYDDAGVQTTLASQTVVIPDRVSPYDWGTFSLLLDSAAVPGAAVGKSIGIKFDNVTDGSWLGIDNVRLTYTAGGATNPQPGDGSTVTDLNLPELCWDNLENVGAADVWFGTGADVNEVNYQDYLTLIGSIESPASTSCQSLSGYTPLDVPETYYWVVEAYGYPDWDPNGLGDPNALLSNALWSFSTSAIPLAQTSPDNQFKFDGETASFSVQFLALTPVTDAVWYQDGAPVDDEGDADITVTINDDGSDLYTVTLTIDNTELADEGTYDCIAENSGGFSDPSDSADLTIKRQIIHYTFDGDVNDASGNALHGTLFGDEPNFVDDAIFVQALEFDGTSDYVRCPNDLDLASPAFDDFRPGMTITVWAKPDAVANWARFTDFGSGAGVDNILFTRIGTGTTLRFDTSSGTLDATNTIALDEWQMFAVTMDGDGNAVLYKNGLPVIDGTVGLPAVAPRTLNYVGESNWSADAFYSGLMDDLQVWNYALTEDNIADMYAAGVGNFCRYPENVGEFDLSGNCKVDLPDLAIFVSTWLNCGFPGCP